MLVALRWMSQGGRSRHSLTLLLCTRSLAWSTVTGPPERDSRKVISPFTTSELAGVVKVFLFFPPPSTSLCFLMKRIWDRVYRIGAGLRPRSTLSHHLSLSPIFPSLPLYLYLSLTYAYDSSLRSLIHVQAGCSTVVPYSPFVIP